MVGKSTNFKIKDKREIYFIRVLRNQLSFDVETVSFMISKGFIHSLLRDSKVGDPSEKTVPRWSTDGPRHHQSRGFIKIQSSNGRNAIRDDLCAGHDLNKKSVAGQNVPYASHARLSRSMTLSADCEESSRENARIRNTRRGQTRCKRSDRIGRSTLKCNLFESSFYVG